MASDTIKTKDNILLKCKECGIFKVLNKDNWYSHPEGYLGVLGRCKECIKRGRKSERELAMARIIDKKRSKNPKRKLQLKILSLKRRMEKGYGPTHGKTERKINKLGIRPKYCCFCQNKSKVIAHHPDYNKRNEVVFCCPQCHAKIHKGEIFIDKKDIINLLNIG